MTSALIALLAAGLAAQAVPLLSNAGVITIFDPTVWNTSAILPENSIVGRLLHTLIGYTDPSDRRAEQSGTPAQRAAA